MTYEWDNKKPTAQKLGRWQPFQDGHYIYQVLPGYGVGSQAEAPTLFIADLENPSQLHIIVKP